MELQHGGDLIFPVHRSYNYLEMLMGEGAHALKLSDESFAITSIA